MRDLVFGHALGVGHVAAVLVDQVDELLRHADELPCMTSGRPGQVFMICSMRSNASLASCLNLNAPWLVPMATARRVDAGAFCQKSVGLLRVGQELLDVLLVLFGVQADDVFLDPAEHAQLGFDDHAGRVGDLHRFGGELDVLFVRMVRAVDHDGGVAVVDARS